MRRNKLKKLATLSMSRTTRRHVHPITFFSQRTYTSPLPSAEPHSYKRTYTTTSSSLRPLDKTSFTKQQGSNENNFEHQTVQNGFGGAFALISAGVIIGDFLANNNGRNIKEDQLVSLLKEPLEKNEKIYLDKVLKSHGYNLILKRIDFEKILTNLTLSTQDRYNKEQVEEFLAHNVQCVGIDFVGCLNIKVGVIIGCTFNDCNFFNIKHNKKSIHSIHSRFNNCTFYNCYSSLFEYSTFMSCHFNDVDSVLSFKHSSFKKCLFGRTNSKLNFEFSDFISCEFHTTNYPSFKEKCCLVDCKDDEGELFHDVTNIPYVVVSYFDKPSPTIGADYEAKKKVYEDTKYLITVLQKQGIQVVRVRNEIGLNHPIFEVLDKIDGIILRSGSGVSRSFEFALKALSLKGNIPLFDPGCKGVSDGATKTAFETFLKLVNNHLESREENIEGLAKDNEYRPS